ncbi:hypothetical protein D9N18_09270 [Lactococcus raffinolactis]|uniref:phosphoribosyltransferase-like protein n=1 Tax=Pseudolactococcus raffinolactis TaxID=1366 RepID=UPI001C6FF14A|nr:hypothetical protein [Lactococcus raffinolactis]MBW9331542.1 hypothetical protein [Lactococcus raffinolactis]
MGLVFYYNLHYNKSTFKIKKESIKLFNYMEKNIEKSKILKLVDYIKTIQKRKKFKKIIQNFYKRNNISDEDKEIEKYLKKFQNKLGKFLGQENLKKNEKIKKEILNCIESDYSFYPQSIIDKRLRSLYDDIKINYLADNFICAPILNNDTTTSNSSHDLVHSFININQIQNSKIFSFNHYIDLLNKKNEYKSKKDTTPNIISYREESSKHLEKEEKKIKTKFQNISSLILIDDYTGTGQTVIDFILKIENSLPQNVTIILFFIHSTKIAKKNIYELKNKIKNDVIFVCKDITDKYFANNPEIETEFRKFETNIVRPRREREVLGFDETESVVTLSRNTPNNTLSIFWSSNIEWVPLFPRDEKTDKQKPLINEQKYVKYITWFINDEYPTFSSNEKMKLTFLLYIKFATSLEKTIKLIDLMNILSYNDSVDVLIQECKSEKLFDIDKNLMLLENGIFFLKNHNLYDLEISTIIKKYSKKVNKITSSNFTNSFT